MAVNLQLVPQTSEPTELAIRRDEKLPNPLPLEIFSRMTSLRIEWPIPTRELQTLLSVGRSLQVIKLKMGPRQPLSLASFEVAQALRELELDAKGVDYSLHADYSKRVTPFVNPKGLVQLTSLSLVHLNFAPGVVASIARLPLEQLTLSSEISEEENLQPLVACKTLKRLNLEGVHFPGQLGVYSCKVGELLLLHKALPTTQITPASEHPGFADYRDVLSSQKRSSHCYSRSHKLQQLDVSALFHNNREDLSWSVSLSNQQANRWRMVPGVNPPYDHNQCPVDFYYAGSPIKRPDGGFWIAAPEPHDCESRGDFWSVVEQHSSLIIMVKEIEEIYFPQALGESKTYVGQKAKTQVTYVACSSILENFLTVREFRVGEKNKKVFHMQVNWPDGKAIAVEKLTCLIEFVSTFEKKLPEKNHLVHCFAGWGRTGTFIACMLVKLLVEQKGKAESEFINLEALLDALRQQRKLIQSLEQFFLVFEYFQALFPAD